MGDPEHSLTVDMRFLTGFAMGAPQRLPRMAGCLCLGYLQEMAPRHCFDRLPGLPQGPPPPASYGLRGPQVQPDASYWHTPPCRPLCIVRPEDLNCPVRKFPPDNVVVGSEIPELHELKQLRDDPQAVAGNFGNSQRRRLQLSPLLQLRPPPLGAVFNRRRPDPQPIERIERELWPIERPDPFTPQEITPTEVPVITTGRELARFFELETPGLSHRHALNAILAQPEFRERFSPPFQALIWCALDITIYSALLAAWFFKWRGPVGVGRVGHRPRPAEFDPSVSVLYDRRPNDTQSGDDGLQILPSGRRPEPGQLPPLPSRGSPGTPRHPSYPSGHTTAYAAGSELLAAFFPDLRAELEQLADNAGVARLWAGIHYRSDHLWGLELGRCVALRVIQQLQGSCICPPDPCNPPPPCQDPPTREQLQQDAAEHRKCCVKELDGHAAIEVEEQPAGQLPQLDPAQQPEVEPELLEEEEYEQPEERREDK
jgi:membrane-associated phospholipid phosphatase